MVSGDDFINDLPDDFFQDGTRHDRLNGIVEVFKIIRRNDAPADGESEIIDVRATVGMPQYDRALIGYYAIEPSGSPIAGGFRAVYSMQGILDCLCEDMTWKNRYLRAFRGYAVSWHEAGSYCDSRL